MNPTTTTSANYNPYSGFQDLSSGQAGNGAVQNPSVMAALNQTSQPQTSTAQANPSATPDNSSFLTKLIPTIGSIGGGILGTLVDPFTFGAGTFIGSAAGDALGKALENGIEGKATTGNDLLTAGGEGLLGAGIGKGIGLATKGIGSVIANQATKGLEGEAATQAAQDALGQSQALRNVYGGLKRTTLEGTNPDQALSGAINLSTRVGVNPLNPQEVLNTAKTGLDALGNVRNEVLYKAGNIPTSGVVDETGNKIAPSITDMINSSLHNVHPLTGEQLGPDRTGVLGSLEPVFGAKGKLVIPNNASSQFQTEASNMLGGVLDKSNVNALDLQNAQSVVGQKANDVAQAAASATGKDAIELKAQAAAWQDLNNHLKSMFDNPAVNNEVAAMQGNLTAADVGGNQALADELNSRITNAQTNQDLNTALSHFLNLRNISRDAVAAGNNPASVSAVREAKQALAEANGTANDGNTIYSTTSGNILGAVPHTPAKILGTVLNIGNTGGKLGVAKQTLGTTLQRLGNIGTLAGKAGIPESEAATAAAQKGTGVLPLLAGGIVGNAPSLGASPVPVNTLGANQPTPNNTGDNRVNNQNQLSNYLQALMVGGVLNPTQVGSEASSVLSTLAPVLQKNEAVQNALPSLEQSYANAGGAQGLSGIGSEISSLVPGTAANAYNQQKSALATQLASVLGITPDQAAAYLPGLMQGQPESVNRLSALQSVLGGLAR